MEVIERYLTSTKERATVCCFLAFHEIEDLPKNTNQQLMDHATQSDHTNQLEPTHG